MNLEGLTRERAQLSKDILTYLLKYSWFCAFWVSYVGVWEFFLLYHMGGVGDMGGTTHPGLYNEKTDHRKLLVFFSLVDEQFFKN